jgi:peptidoglycan lytic transglycosylase D
VAPSADRSTGWRWGGGRRGEARWAAGLVLAVAFVTASPAGAVDDFRVTPALAPTVRFWVDVFTRYGSDQAIIHDRVEPWRVYAVVGGGADDVAARVHEVEERLALASLRPPSFVDLVSRVPEPSGVSPVRVQRGMREAFAAALDAQRLYRPTVEAALTREGLPLALAALPLVESSYHPNATSSAGAVGLWQLTRDTARQYLRVARGVDERHDPTRASAAAARHLRALRDALPSWPLALTAYNHGLTGVQRARSALGTDDLGVLIARFRGPGFGFASRNFYAEFLAALQVMRRADQYFPDRARVRMVEYRVKRGDTLYRVARRHGVSLTSLRVTNGLRSASLQPGQRILIRL